MWRRVVLGQLLLAPALMLQGCAGFGDFLGNTLTYGANPNAPVGNSENMNRVRGVMVPVGPLLPEAGNVWPTEFESAPTLQDLEKQQQTNPAPAAPPPDVTPYLPGHRQPRPRDSSTPPGSDQPGVLPPLPIPEPQPEAPSRPLPPATGGRGTILTPQGPLPPATSAPGFQTINPSGAGQPGGIVVPNGNGTSTLIRPDGTVTTVPTPR